jgi:predicted sugar kinase
MPEASTVRAIEGARDDDAQQAFHAKLENVAPELATQIQLIRAYVEKNAEAFERAAARMQETEGADSLAARQAGAFVEEIVATPAAAPSTNSAPASGSSGSQPAPSAPGSTEW